MKRFWCAVLAGLFLFAACSQPAPSGVGGSTRRAAVHSGVLQFTAPAAGDTIAVIQTSEGEIRAVLYGRLAPAAVENFCALAQNGWYGGTSFHRTVKDFAIQGGDVAQAGHERQSLWGGPFLTEYSAGLHHYTGALCMAADGGLNTHLTEFYILATPQDGLADAATVQRLLRAGYPEDVAETYRQAGGAPYLDYTDTVFGQVYAGMDVVDKIANAADEESETPANPAAILSISIEVYKGAPAGGSSSAPSGEGTGGDAGSSTPGSSLPESTP